MLGGINLQQSLEGELFCNYFFGGSSYKIFWWDPLIGLGVFGGVGDDKL